MAWAVVLLRFAEYGAAAGLFGASLLLLLNPLGEEAPAGTERLLTGGASILAMAAPLHVLAQTALLAGSLSAALGADALGAVFSQMAFGKASIVRMVFALLAVGAGVALSGRARWRVSLALGAGCGASFAWMGHGAAGGWLHLAADIVHLLAAMGWIGALAAFCLALRRSPPAQLHRALRDFSGLGSVLVALLVFSGLINNAILVGWDIGKALSTPYGQILAAKLGLFALMLCLAAANRWRLTPALGSNVPAAMAGLRRSIALETALGFGVVALVAWLGTLPPVLE